MTFYSEHSCFVVNTNSCTLVIPNKNFKYFSIKINNFVYALLYKNSTHPTLPAKKKYFVYSASIYRNVKLRNIDKKKLTIINLIDMSYFFIFYTKVMPCEMRILILIDLVKEMLCIKNRY